MSDNENELSDYWQMKELSSTIHRYRVDLREQESEKDTAEQKIAYTTQQIAKYEYKLRDLISKLGFAGGN